MAQKDLGNMRSCIEGLPCKIDLLGKAREQGFSGNVPLGTIELFCWLNTESPDRVLMVRV